MVAITRLAQQFDFDLDEGPSELKQSASGSYVVLLDDPNATNAQVAALTLDGASLAFGKWTKHVTAFPGSPACLLRERAILQEGKNPNARRIALEFNVDRIEKDETEPDPTQRPMEVSLRTTLEQRPTVWAPDGSPLINDAGTLYRDQTRYVVLFNYTCTFSEDEPVDWPGSLSGFTNSTAVTIRGITWPPNTLRFLDFDHAEKPEYAGDIEHWPHGFGLVGDMDGYYRVLPNFGPDELSYQILKTVGSRPAWQPATVADYTSEPAATRRIRRIRIKDSKGDDAEGWLDSNGQAITNPLIQSRQLSTTGTIAAGSKQLAIPGATLDPSNVGSGITITRIGMKGRRMHTRIQNVVSATIVDLEHEAIEAASGNATVILSGVLVKVWDRQDRFDFNSVLPAFPT